MDAAGKDDNDATLLRRFVATRDEQAFALLVRRHVDLVYAAARRQGRDDAAAQDVTQQVFVLLAERAGTIRDGEAVAGWLLVTTRYVALNSIRADARRRRHEREAAVMQEKRTSETGPAGAAAWTQVGPVLDEVVAKLKREDRDALALRYFQGRSVADIAAALGVSQEAAQKRLSRAIERLRDLFARRGVTTSAEALSSVLMANAVVAAPAALGPTVAGAALSAATVASMTSGVAGGSTKGALAIMAMAKTKLAAASVAAVMLVGVTGTIAYQQLRTPSGKSRQVRVDPAAAAAAAQRQTLQVAADPAWRQRFNAVYALKPNETLKRVPTPWIAERMQFYQVTASTTQVESVPQGPDAILIAQEADGTLAWKQMSFGAAPNVRWVLREVLEVSPQEVDLPPKIMSLTMPGDWVYRPGSTLEARMTDFASALSQAAGQTYAFALQPREREAIVVSGVYAFHPWPGAAQDPGGTLYLNLADPGKQAGFSGAGGRISQAFEQLGDVTNLPIVFETPLPERGGASNWKIDASVAPYMNGRKPMDGATADLLLANLSKQTSLQLKRERRVVPTWVPTTSATTMPSPTTPSPTTPSPTTPSPTTPSPTTPLSSATRGDERKNRSA